MVNRLLVIRKLNYLTTVSALGLVYICPEFFSTENLFQSQIFWSGDVWRTKPSTTYHCHPMLEYISDVFWLFFTAFKFQGIMTNALHYSPSECSHFPENIQQSCAVHDSQGDLEQCDTGTSYVRTISYFNSGLEFYVPNLEHSEFDENICLRIKTNWKAEEIDLHSLEY